ncbi:MAG: MoaD/ThiS family protein [Fuerstia sp.]|nr:MoaD/ThiS family protein [Fuerstiella sp.]
MKLSVLLFAAAREIAGCESVELILPEAGTVAQARAALLQSLPNLAIRTGTLLWAVNNEYASDNRVLQDTDVVACFPPVSGG